MKGPRILIGCYEVPRFGGASTSSYGLFQTLRADGHDASLVNLIREEDREFFEYTFGERLGNPDGLDGVETCRFTGPPGAPQADLARRIARRAPDVILAVGFNACNLLRGAAPAARLAFLTTGCQQAAAAIVTGRAADAIALSEAPGSPRRHEALEERAAVEAADLVITHSTSTQRFFGAYYPAWRGKLHPRVVWLAEWVHRDALRHAWRARPFDAREVGLLFVASSWDRSEKNYPLVEAIASRLPGRSIHVVGDVPRRLRSVVHHGFLSDADELFELLGNARAVVCPSRLDAAPHVLFDAAALGCNVVASRNCGNWELCHPSLLAERCAPDAFAACCERALERRFEDGRQVFLGSGSYRELVETLEALAWVPP